MTLRRKMAIATWAAPAEGNIYGKLTLDCTEAKKYLAHIRETTGQKVTITHLIGKALGEALAATPTLNGRILFRRFIPYPSVSVSFLVALEDGKNLFKLKIDDADTKSVADIARELRERAERLHSKDDKQLSHMMNVLKMVPRVLLPSVLWVNGFLGGALGIDSKLMGIEKFPFGAAVITSVGMLGFDEGYAPPTPFARVPILLLVGAMKPRPVVVDGELAVRDTINIMATIDHRFIDGYQLGSVAKIFKRVIEDPWHMEDSPPISDSVADTNAQVLPDSSQERAVS